MDETLANRDGILCYWKGPPLLLKRMEFGMFFTQEAFLEGKMLMPLSNTKIWQPELTPKMSWHFQLLLPPHGIEKPTARTSKKYPDYQDTEHLGRNWRADVPAPLRGI